MQSMAFCLMQRKEIIHIDALVDATLMLLLEGIVEKKKKESEKNEGYTFYFGLGNSR